MELFVTKATWTYDYMPVLGAIALYDVLPPDGGNYTTVAEDLQAVVRRLSTMCDLQDKRVIYRDPNHMWHAVVLADIKTEITATTRELHCSNMVDALHIVGCN